MDTKRYSPRFDRLFWSLFIPTNALSLAVVIVLALFSMQTLFFSVPVLLFVNYFFVSSLFGYVELRENEMFIKYGFFLKKQIPYSRIRSLEKERKFYSDSMLALKNSFEHVNIKYNSFDVTTVSVTDNDAFIAELEERRATRSRGDAPPK